MEFLAIVVIVVLAAAVITIPSIRKIRKSQQPRRKRRKRIDHNGQPVARKSRSRKKWGIAAASLAVLIIAGVIGYPYAMSYISGKMMNTIADQLVTSSEIEEMKKDPEIQKILEQNVPSLSVPATSVQDTSAPAGSEMQETAAAADPEKTSDGSKQQPATTDKPADNSTSGSGSEVMSHEDASKLLLSKFSKSELLSLAEKAKGGLTSEEKQEIKEKLMSRVSSEEFRALKVAALVELAKRDE